MSFPLVYVDIISLSHFWPGVRKTHFIRAPVPLCTEHSSLQIMVDHSLKDQSACCRTHWRRFLTAATVRKGRFLAIHLEMLCLLRIRARVSCEREVYNCLPNYLYVIFGVIRIVRRTLLSNLGSHSLGLPERGFECPSGRSAARQTVLRAPSVIQLTNFAAVAYVAPAATAPSIFPR